MATGEFVDVDLYGRGFDGVFGPGSEVESRRQTIMKFQAMKRFQERVKPGEYIDLDLYGRGDPRIFGPGAHIETQKKAQSHLQEAQQTKTARKFHLRAVVFPPGIKAIAKKARAVIKRISSKTDDSESDIQTGSANSTEGNEEGLAKNDVQDTIAESQGGGQRIADEESSPVEDTSRNGEAMNVTTDEKKVPSTEDAVVGPEYADDGSAEPEVIDRAPRRFKSRLPSEEVRPQVEKGLVARAVKSFSSFDRSDEQIKFTSRAANGDLSRLAAFSSLPLRRNSRPEVPEASSNKTVNTGNLQNNARPDPVSMTEEDRRVRDGSDEELQLSFSSPPQIPVALQSTDDSSTSSDEDLITTNSRSDQIVLDEAGRSVVDRNKITELFRSGDSDFDPKADGIDNSLEPGGSDKPPEKPPSTFDENFSENIARATDSSKNDVHPGVEDSMAIQQDDEEEPESNMDSRGTSIIQVVETPRLTSQELVEEALLHRFEDEEREMEARMASMSGMETAQPAINESTEYSAAEIVDAIEDSPDSAINVTTEYSAAEFVDVTEAGLNPPINESTEYSAAEIVVDIEETPDPAINETTEYSAAEILDTADDYLPPAITGTTQHSVAEVVEGITVTEDLTTIETTEHSAEEVIGKGTSSDNSDSSTADYEEDSSIETAGNEQDSESFIEDSDRSGEAGSSSEVMTSSPEEDSDDVEAEEVDSSEIEEEMEEADNVVEVEHAEEAEDNAVLVVDSIVANLNSQNDTDDGKNRENPDEQNNDSGNEADGADQDQANNNKTFWQRLGLFNVVMTSSWMVF